MSGKRRKKRKGKRRGEGRSEGRKHEAVKRKRNEEREPNLIEDEGNEGEYHVKGK